MRGFPTSRVFDPGPHQVHEAVGTENSERRVHRRAPACSRATRADTYGLHRMDRPCRLVPDEWLRSFRSVCALIDPPKSRHLRGAVLSVILVYGRKFENTVEVGSAELKRGKFPDRQISF